MEQTVTAKAKRPRVSRFSACLMLVILSVFSWAMHRRLAQYDTVQQGDHHPTAIKVCLTKRIAVPLPLIRAIDNSTVLFLAFAFAAALAWLSNAQAARKLHVVRQGRRASHPARGRPSLTHFFFFPPPSRLSLAS